jgi:hypothetical protein
MLLEIRVPKYEAVKTLIPNGAPRKTKDKNWTWQPRFAGTWLEKQAY